MHRYGWPLCRTGRRQDNASPAEGVRNAGGRAIAAEIRETTRRGKKTLTFGHANSVRFILKMTFEGADSLEDVEGCPPTQPRACFSGRDEISVLEMCSLTCEACGR